jgi:hypothetical protein
MDSELGHLVNPLDPLLETKPAEQTQLTYAHFEQVFELGFCLKINDQFWGYLFISISRQHRSFLRDMWLKRINKRNQLPALGR